MTQEKLQNLLFHSFNSIGKDEDGEFRIMLDADQDCDEPVAIYIRLSEVHLRVYGVCPKFLKIDNENISKTLVLINRWNAEKLFPKAYVTKNENVWYVMAEGYLIMDEDDNTLPDLYVENFIKRMAAFIWQFYVSLNKGRIEK